MDIIRYAKQLVHCWQSAFLGQLPVDTAKVLQCCCTGEHQSIRGAKESRDDRAVRLLFAMLMFSACRTCLDTISTSYITLCEVLERRRSMTRPTLTEPFEFAHKPKYSKLSGTCQWSGGLRTAGTAQLCCQHTPPLTTPDNTIPNGGQRGVAPSGLFWCGSSLLWSERAEPPVALARATACPPATGTPQPARPKCSPLDRSGCLRHPTCHHQHQRASCCRRSRAKSQSPERAARG